jgi:hypothetical protein
MESKWKTTLLLPLQDGLFPERDKVLEVAPRICKMMKYEIAKSQGFGCKA